MDDFRDLLRIGLRVHCILTFASGMNMVSIALPVQLVWEAGVYAGYAPGLPDRESCAWAMLSTKSILATVEFCESEAVLGKELHHFGAFQ